MDTHTHKEREGESERGERQRERERERETIFYQYATIFIQQITHMLLFTIVQKTCFDNFPDIQNINICKSIDIGYKVSILSDDGIH